MARQTGFYFVKVRRGDPWEIYYWSTSAHAWLYNQKRYTDKDLGIIHEKRIHTPDETGLQTFNDNYKYPTEK